MACSFLNSRFVAAAVAVALSSPAFAQVSIGGPLSDSTTGPLMSGVVYHATSSISVLSGTTLTVQPGAIVKFGFDRSFDVSGTLNCNGTGLDSIIFTDIRDDSAGGDTNGDGAATSPAPGWWRSMLFTLNSDSSQVNGVTVRYAGRFRPGFGLQSCDASFVNCKAELCAHDGFNLNNNSFATLTGCRAESCSSEAFTGVPLPSVPSFSGLVATGNGFNRLRVTVGAVPAGTNLVLDPSNLISNTLYASTSINVPSNSELTVQPGTVIKFSFDRTLFVDGVLDCNGTLAAPVVFTDERDDSVGGDTNNDGAATAPAPGWFRGLHLRAGSDASTLDRTEIRFAGRFLAGLELSNTAPTLRNCTVRDCSDDAVDLNVGSRPVIENLSVFNCSGTAIVNADLRALPSFSGLQFSGNGFNRIQVTIANLLAGESMTLMRSQVFQDTVYLATGVNVASGASLTVERGMVCKMSFDRTWTINGLLNLEGTASERVTITDIRDDSVGGDTNNDGSATVPAEGWWRGIAFNDSSDGSRADFTDIKYAGRFLSGFEMNNASITLNRCHVSDCASAGLDFNNSSAVCLVERVRVDNCGGAAIQNVRFQRLQDIQFATGGGNDLNTIRVSSGTLTEDATIEPNNQFNGSILCATSLTVPSGIALNLQPGVVLKMAFDRTITIAGRLTVRGSLDNPAIITEEGDDSVGGDTNGNGSATVPVPGYWRGINFTSTTDPSIVIGLEVRYAGRFQPSINCSSALTAMREVRSSFSSSSGFRFTAHAIPLERIVAFSNGFDGIELEGGTFDVRQVSCVGNSFFGVDAAAAYTGTVRDSIMWSNGLSAVDGLGAGRVLYSDGVTALAGSDGNIDTDPQFVNEATGVLHLASGSPCINAGNPASPLDPDSTRADMGALFFNFCAPEIICTQPQTFPPCDPTLTWDGFASLSSPQPFVLTLNDAPTLSFAIFFYGIGTPTLINGAFGDICVGGPFQRTPPVASGGNPAEGPCAGRFEFDFNAYAQTGADPAIIAGSNVIGHLWYRYGAAPGNARFSDGIQIPICP